MLLLLLLMVTQAIDYAQNKSKATVVLERGPEALADPTLAFNQDGKAKKNKLTFSSAGAELRGRERKRLREEAGQRDSGSDDSDVDEADEEDDDGDGEKVDGPPDEKRRKAESNGAKSDDEGELKTKGVPESTEPSHQLLTEHICDHTSQCRGDANGRLR